MDIESFREFCLELGEVTEKMPFGKFARRYDSLLVFYVCGHMFCMVDIDDFTCVTVRSTADEIDAIRLRYASSGSPLNPAMKYWVQLDFGGDIDDSHILALVRRAYEIVRTKYTRKTGS